MARDATWDNKDGLVVGFGTRTPVYSGSYSVASDRRDGISTLVYRFRGEDLADDVSTSGDALIHAPVIPNGSIIKSATLYVTEAFAGATAVLDIGVYSGLDESTVDDDGIDAAVAVTSIDAIGDTITCDGADVGTVVATTGGVKIAASYDTAAFTAGEAILTVEFVPAPSSG